MTSRFSFQQVSSIAIALTIASGAPTTGLAASPGPPGQTTQAPADTTSYKVDMHIEYDGERMVMRRYVDGNRSRMEIDNDGETLVVIEAGDAARTTYTIVPSMKRVMKSTLPQDAVVATTTTAGSATTTAEATDDSLELVGTETLDGRSVQKYRVKMPGGDGFMWVDPSTQLPVRMEAGGSRVEMRNYEFSKPAPELFEIPKGYEVMDLDQMMKGFSAARMVAGGLASGYAAQAGGNLGGNLGAGVGGALGGPIGSMVGRFLGQKIGSALGKKAAGSVVN